MENIVLNYYNTYYIDYYKLTFRRKYYYYVHITFQIITKNYIFKIFINNLLMEKFEELSKEKESNKFHNNKN